MLLLSWWVFVFAFFFFLSFFLSLFLVPACLLLSSHCSVLIHPLLGWHKCRLPSAMPEHSSFGSPWLPRGPGQERRGKHRMSLSWSCPQGVPHCASRQAGTSQVAGTSQASPRHAVQRRKTCNEALHDVKVEDGTQEQSHTTGGQKW